MITAANRIYVKREFATVFEDNFQNRAKLVDGMPGFVSNLLLRPTKEDEPYIVLTFWESRAAFDTWVKSDAFVKGHARSGSLPKEAFAKPSNVELHEVISDSSKPDLVPEPRGPALRGHEG